MDHLAPHVINLLFLNDSLSSPFGSSSNIPLKFHYILFIWLKFEFLQLKSNPL